MTDFLSPTVAVSRMIKAAKASKGLDWTEISEKLKEMDVHISPNNLAVKVSRGTLKATEFVCLMRVLGSAFIDLSTLK